MEKDAWQAFIERDAIIAKNLLAGNTCNKCQYRAEMRTRGTVSAKGVDAIEYFMCGKIIATPKAFPDENTCEIFDNSIGGHFIIRNWDGMHMNVDVVE